MPTTTTTMSGGPPLRSSPPTVDIIASPTAQAYSYAHHALLISLYLVRFPALVADPVSTMLSDLPVVAALQVAYAVTCLPQAGANPVQLHQQENQTEGDSVPGTPGKRSVSGSSSLKAGKSPYRKKHSTPHTHSHSKRDSNNILNKISASLLSLTLTFLLGTPVLTILLVLFGAPVTTHIPHTVLCGAHMSVLSALSLIYVHGVNGAVWHEVWSLSRPTDTVWGGALGTAIGAWLGAIPIPLDWDRPWQAWPITILSGAYLGYAAGSLIGRTPLVYGKVLEFDFSTEDEREREKEAAEKGKVEEEKKRS